MRSRFAILAAVVSVVLLALLGGAAVDCCAIWCPNQ